jgi:hypothetical protein
MFTKRFDAGVSTVFVFCHAALRKRVKKSAIVCYDCHDIQKKMVNM